MPQGCLVSTLSRHRATAGEILNKNSVCHLDDDNFHDIFDTNMIR